MLYTLGHDANSTNLNSPVSKHTSVRIVPNGLQAWCMRRNIVWECFCALVTDENVPLRFSTNVMGHSMALCHYNPSQCGFSRESFLSVFFNLVIYMAIFAVDLHEKRHTAVLESTYNHILTKGKFLDDFFLRLFRTPECRPTWISAYYSAGVTIRIQTRIFCHATWSAYTLLRRLLRESSFIISVGRSATPRSYHPSPSLFW